MRAEGPGPDAGVVLIFQAESLAMAAAAARRVLETGDDYRSLFVEPLPADYQPRRPRA